LARILVVEDDPQLRALVVRILGASGHDVAAAPNGKAALAELGAGAFDLIITDVVMPEMEGLELIRQVRKLPRPVSIIAMSSGGRGSADDYLQLAATLGAAATLEKPFTVSAIVETVSRVLSSESDRGQS
jgi:CheY-like chemotaxis protein